MYVARLVTAAPGDHCCARGRVITAVGRPFCLYLDHVTPGPQGFRAASAGDIIARTGE